VEAHICRPHGMVGQSGSVTWLARDNRAHHSAILRARVTLVPWHHHAQSAQFVGDLSHPRQSGKTKEVVNGEDSVLSAERREKLGTRKRTLKSPEDRAACVIDGFVVRFRSRCPRLNCRVSCSSRVTGLRSQRFAQARV
jgi:hypothetical protein